jgi:hypothetical protein
MTRASVCVRGFLLPGFCALTLVAGCKIEFSLEPDYIPQPPYLGPAGTAERGATFTVWTTGRREPNGQAVTLQPGEVDFQPASAVRYDSATRLFTWLSLGTVTLTETGVPSPLQSTVKVVEAPTVFFDMSVDGNRDIYSVTMRGVNLTRVTTDPADDVRPTVVGNTLIFTSYRDGNGELYALRLDTPDSEERLSNTPANETDPALSPNGSQLAYVRDDGGAPRIWIADATNGGAKPLTDAAPGTTEATPRWWSTSDNLLFAAKTDGNFSLFRTSSVAGSTPRAYARPATADSSYSEPDPGSLTSANASHGAFYFVRSKPGGPSRIELSSVNYMGVPNLGYPPMLPAGISAAQPRYISGRILMTVLEADGSTSLAWTQATTPAAPGFFRIPLPGSNPQHAAIVRP